MKVKLGWQRAQNRQDKQWFVPPQQEDFTAQEVNQTKRTPFTEITSQISIALESRAAVI